MKVRADRYIPLVLAGALLVAHGAAQGATKAQQAEIDAMVNRAYELRKAGDDQSALKVLEEAAGIERQPRVMAQKGMAEQALGLWSAAERDLGEGLARAEDPWITRNRGTLDAAMSVIREHLATLDIWGPPDGAKIILDGELIGTTPLKAPLRVPAASIEIVIQAEGHAEATRSFNLKPGSKTREHVVLRALASTAATPDARGEPIATPSTAPRSPREPSHARTPGYAWTVGLASGAAVSLAFGVWQHVAWRNAQGDFERVDGCYASLPNHGTDARCAGLYDTLARHRTWTYVGYGAAGALAIGAGVAAWFAATSARPGDSAAASAGPAPPLASAFAISMSPSSWALSFQRAF